MIKAESYIKGTDETLEVGEKYYFGQLWDGNGDGQELLESGQTTVYDEEENDHVCNFEVIKKEEDVSESVVLIKSIW